VIRPATTALSFLCSVFLVAGCATKGDLEALRKELVESRLQQEQANTAFRNDLASARAEFDEKLSSGLDATKQQQEQADKAIRQDMASVTASTTKEIVNLRNRTDTEVKRLDVRDRELDTRISDIGNRVSQIEVKIVESGQEFIHKCREIAEKRLQKLTMEVSCDYKRSLKDKLRDDQLADLYRPGEDHSKGEFKNGILPTDTDTRRSKVDAFYLGRRTKTEYWLAAIPLKHDILDHNKYNDIFPDYLVEFNRAGFLPEGLAKDRNRLIMKEKQIVIRFIINDKSSVGIPLCTVLTWSDSTGLILCVVGFDTDALAEESLQDYLPGPRYEEYRGKEYVFPCITTDQDSVESRKLLLDNRRNKDLGNDVKLVAITGRMGILFCPDQKGPVSVFALGLQKTESEALFVPFSKVIEDVRVRSREMMNKPIPSLTINEHAILFYGEQPKRQSMLGNLGTHLDLYMQRQ